MDLIRQLVDLVLHLDRHLSTVIQDYGVWTYLILFLIIFCETGLVVTPILPGDSLLFAVGTFAARGALDVSLVLFLLSLAAVAGDTLNYAIGYRIGPQIFSKEGVRFLNREYLDRTHRFYERHGAKTIVIARFVPIIRTFAPFVAGIGRMSYAALRDVQRGRRRRLDRVAWCWGATRSATSRWSRRTSPWSSSRSSRCPSCPAWSSSCASAPGPHDLAPPAPIPTARGSLHRQSGRGTTAPGSGRTSAPRERGSLHRVTRQPGAATPAPDEGERAKRP